MEGRDGEGAVVPEVRGQVTVGLGDGLEGSLDEVTQSPGGTARGGVDILNTGELQQLLGDTSGNKTSTTGGGDETDRDGTALSGDLHGDGMGGTEVVTPVSTTDGDDGQLGEDDGSTDGSGNLLGALDTKTAVTVGVTNNDEGLEASTLTGTGLLLDRHDLHDLILKRFTQELINDLELFDGEGEKVDLLKRGDVVGLYETSKLGDGLPGLTFGLSTSSATATATATTVTTTATTATTVSTSKSSTGWCFASHMLKKRKEEVRKKKKKMAKEEAPWKKRERGKGKKKDSKGNSKGREEETRIKSFQREDRGRTGGARDGKEGETHVCLRLTSKEKREKKEKGNGDERALFDVFVRYTMDIVI